MNTPEKTVIRKLKPGHSRCWNPITKKYEEFDVPVRWSIHSRQYIPIHKSIEPKDGSREYPKWICKGGCMSKPENKAIDSNTKLKKCPYCNQNPLIRYLRYEQKI